MEDRQRRQQPGSSTAARAEYENIFWTAPEYQLLDDANAPDGSSRLSSAAAAYGLYPAPAGVVKAGRRVEHDAHRRSTARTSSTG